MTPQPERGVGVMVSRDLPAEQFVRYAQRAEELGFSELWVVEDLGFAGGVAQAATVLASTSAISVGLGILPMGARNVAFTAMELTTLARLFPGRIRAGIGHGMPDWMRAAGAWRSSQLALLQEYTRALRALLRGEHVTTSGRYVQLAGVQLEAVAEPVPPVLAGVRGPRSLVIAGAEADGVILAEPTAPEYVVGAIGQLRNSDAHVVAFALAAIAGDAETAIARVRPALKVVGEPEWAAHLVPMPFADELSKLRSSVASADAFADALPESWIQHLALAGTTADVRAGLDRIHAAGAQTVVLIPTGPNPLACLTDLRHAL